MVKQNYNQHFSKLSLYLYNLLIRQALDSDQNGFILRIYNKAYNHPNK